MEINALSIYPFLPLWMRNDSSAYGIAYALENQIRKLTEQIDHAQIYANIDKLPEPLLDELAWQFNVIEYSGILPLDVKRKLVQTCFETHALRGTKAAVEKVINSVFGNGYVEEWFEYSGNAGHFKVHTSNAGTSDEMVAEFERAVKSTQNVRSFLEAVVVENVVNMNVNVGIYMHTADFIYI